MTRHGPLQAGHPLNQNPGGEAIARGESCSRNKDMRPLFLSLFVLGKLLDDKNSKSTERYADIGKTQQELVTANINGIFKVER
jgi:hypothetical protein